MVEQNTYAQAGIPTHMIHLIYLLISNLHGFSIDGDVYIKLLDYPLKFFHHHPKLEHDQYLIFERSAYNQGICKFDLLQ